MTMGRRHGGVPPTCAREHEETTTKSVTHRRWRVKHWQLRRRPTTWRGWLVAIAAATAVVVLKLTVGVAVVGFVWQHVLH
jgi:hypothetical protein